MLIDPETLMTRDQAARALTQAGFPTAKATLATRATRGGGPPYRLFGVKPLYRWSDVLAWAQSRLSEPRRSTSEQDVRGRLGQRTAAMATTASEKPKAKGAGGRRNNERTARLKLRDTAG
jgi:hypothetical protein